MIYDQSRPPMFFFKDIETGINEEKSSELGYPVPKFTTMLFITPHDQKGGPSEFIADDFMARKEKEAALGNYDPSWIAIFKEKYKAYKEGREMPVNGTPLITYERIAKQRREDLAFRFPTVEDLASVPDSALSDIGLDGRVLRDLARLDIKAKKDMSPVVAELANANETIRRQQEQLVQLSSRLDALEEKPRKKAVA
jgi:hypothetical protein